MSVTRPVYPFSALVGQERLKRALTLSSINPRVGGVLIRGEKGTAKSTAVRGLARLLPTIVVVEGCPYNGAEDERAEVCVSYRQARQRDATYRLVKQATPLVELPVSASEDRVVGSLDLEHAITEGQRRFEPGLLAQANRGILYVDEVNLLDDHLVDLLLDAAAMGINTVEREGISISHPARFNLIGTMNPEEGELRPQLLDRFGLAVEIKGLKNVADRVAVIERRMAYDEAPGAFIEQWQATDHEITDRINSARELLPQVVMRNSDLALIAGLVLELGVDGHRADLTILEAARTNAAWSGRTYISTEDIQIAAELALPHRMHRHPFSQESLSAQTVAEAIERSSEAVEPGGQATGDEEKKNSSDEPGEEIASAIGTTESTAAGGGESASGEAASRGSHEAPTGQEQNKFYDSGDIFQVQRFDGDKDRKHRRSGGKRSRTRTQRRQGRYVTHRRVDRVTDLAFDATVREAAPYQRARHATRSAQLASLPPDQLQPRLPRLILQRSDLRQKVRVRRTRNAVCFVVDASWSMAAEERMEATKAAVLSLLQDAYQRRDQVGLVSFQRTYAHVLLPLTSSVELAQRRLQKMPTGGKTPLAQGMLTGFELLERARRQDPEVMPLMVLITDGQANVAMGRLPPQQEAYKIAAAIGDDGMRTVVINTEHPNFDRGLTRQLATHMQGEYYHLEELKNGGLVRVVRTRLNR